MTTRTERPVTREAHTVGRDHKNFLPEVGGYLLGAARLAFGFTFLWAFLDKLLGLGFATPREGAWISGGSPTTGYLSNVEGPLAGFYTAMAGSTAIDWLFMLGLLGIGLTLMLGMGARVGGLAGALMYLFMYGASLPLVTNPFLNDYITGALVMLAFAAIPATWGYLGLGKVWQRTAPSYLW